MTDLDVGRTSGGIHEPASEHTQSPLHCDRCGQLRTSGEAPFCSNCGAPVGPYQSRVPPLADPLRPQYQQWAPTVRVPDPQPSAQAWYPNQQPPPATPEPTRLPRGKRTKLFVLIGSAVALAVVAVLIFATTRPVSGPVGSATFTMSGTMTLYDPSSIADTGSCAGTGGYSDIYAGTNITLYNNTGTIVGVGSLVGGTGIGGGQCYFTFSIPDVPAAQGPYQYEISHRGRLTLTEAEARSGTAGGTLGH